MCPAASSLPWCFLNNRGRWLVTLTSVGLSDAEKCRDLDGPRGYLYRILMENVI